ncbi:MAG: hypothetical protein KJN85_12855 [Maribacter sp.]|nr:hypothetical protein [Maribacter sp.]
MIKFFRKIRQDLLNTGKTGRYLQYAIGEIVLVVIGVLIALSINNWNEGQLKRKAEMNFYHNTKQQLLDDANIISSEMQYNSKYSTQFRNALKIIEEGDKNKKDSLGYYTKNLINYSDFDRRGNIYETMVNSGDIKLLKNTEIIERLRRLEETFLYLNRIESIHLDAVMSLIPELSQTVHLSTGEVENVDYLYGFRFQNLYIITLRIMDEKDVVYNRTLNEIDSIVKLIDNELE